MLGGAFAVVASGLTVALLRTAPRARESKRAAISAKIAWGLAQKM